MPINIKMKPGFMYFAATAEGTETSSAIDVPMPGANKPFTTKYNWQTQTAADGSIVGQQIGRSRVTQEMTWEVMDSTKWWEINNWIEDNGMSFYARFFDYNTGAWKTRRFYLESVSCNPWRPGGTNTDHHGQPVYLKDCAMTVYDMGEII